MTPGLQAMAAGAYRVRPLSPFGGRLAQDAIAAGIALPLAGADRAFATVEIVVRDASRENGFSGAAATLGDARKWAGANGSSDRLEALLDALSRRRAPWAGFDLGRPLLMGILNVTPDSFSDGGRFLGPTAAVGHAAALLEAGADIIDVGGESTRPGAEPVAPAEEVARIEPVVRALAERGAIVSIDTRHAATMRAALAAGARIVNDVTALAGEPESLSVAAASKAAVVLMHMRGEPRTMQADPRYDCAPLDVLEHLEARIAACETTGIPRERIAVDPGLGFGKRPKHNFEILQRLSLLHLTGCPILLGASRKSFTAGQDRAVPADRRFPGSLAAALAGLEQGVQLLRVHDVAETRQAIEVWRATAAAG